MIFFENENCFSKCNSSSIFPIIFFRLLKNLDTKKLTQRLPAYLMNFTLVGKGSIRYALSYSFHTRGISSVG